MSDPTRNQDLKELFEAMERAETTEQREKLDEIRHKIIDEDEEVSELRQELVGAVRNSDAKKVRNVSEQIKVIGYKKGFDRNG